MTENTERHQHGATETRRCTIDGPTRLLSQDGIADNPAACDTRSPACGRPAACCCCIAPAPAAHTGSPTRASLTWWSNNPAAGEMRVGETIRQANSIQARPPGAFGDERLRLRKRTRRDFVSDRTSAGSGHSRRGTSHWGICKQAVNRLIVC